MSRIASCAILVKGHSDDPMQCSQAVLPVFRLELELRVQARSARGQSFPDRLKGSKCFSGTCREIRAIPPPTCIPRLATQSRGHRRTWPAG